MKSPLWIRLFLCIFMISFLLYAYIQKQNKIASLRLEIPQLAKDVQELEQENIHLKYKIESFENPLHLMELSRKPEYRHLKQPSINEIVTVPVRQSP